MTYGCCDNPDCQTPAKIVAHRLSDGRTVYLCPHCDFKMYLEEAEAEANGQANETKEDLKDADI